MRRSQALQVQEADRARIPAADIKEGSQVWLDTRHVRTPRPTTKLQWKYFGLFRVIGRISPYPCEIDLPASIRIDRVQHVYFLHPVVNDPLVGQQFDSPPALEVHREGEYLVSSAEDWRIYRGQLQHLIQWTGYNSVRWEPAKFENGLQAVGDSVSNGSG